ncbi:MAG: XdhC family protein [Chloroflexi bacterium]|nr:XdhC family protein [Chloroflexota bacterium]
MSLFDELIELEARGESAALCTITKSRGSTPRHVGSKMLVYADGTISGSVGGGETERRVIEEAKKVLVNGKPSILEYKLDDPKKGDPGLCGGQLEVFVEPITPAPTILVVGAGHIGKAVVHLAYWLGFRVVLSDDRVELCNPEAAPGADVYDNDPVDKITENVRINPHTYIVMATRNSGLDIQSLPALFETPAAYIGVIGSKRRWQLTRDKLIEAGISEEKLNMVVSPMGLDLKAETPEEIALSIMAQIVMRRLGGDGKKMS